LGLESRTDGIFAKKLIPPRLEVDLSFGSTGRGSGNIEREAMWDANPSMHARCWTACFAAEGCTWEGNNCKTMGKIISIGPSPQESEEHEMAIYVLGGIKRPSPKIFETFEGLIYVSSTITGRHESTRRWWAWLLISLDF
jgi:hypothetical protein